MRTGRRTFAILALAVLAAGLLAAPPRPSLAVKPHFFGGIPDASASAGAGVRLAEVRPGSPAEQAGLRTGDVVVRLGTVPIRTVEDFIVALQSALPDQPLTIIYIRHGREYRTEATLEARR